MVETSLAMLLLRPLSRAPCETAAKPVSNLSTFANRYFYIADFQPIAQKSPKTSRRYGTVAAQPREIFGITSYYRRGFHTPIWGFQVDLGFHARDLSSIVSIAINSTFRSSGLHTLKASQIKRLAVGSKIEKAIWCSTSIFSECIASALYTRVINPTSLLAKVTLCAGENPTRSVVLQVRYL
jgi:hypothetical protein